MAEPTPNSEANLSKKYCSLPSIRSFRLLKVSSKPASETPIHCRVEAFDLDNAPKYLALSYTWVSPLPPENESKTLVKTYASRSALSTSPLPSPVFVPDELLLAQLESMGFPRPRCEEALQSTGNGDCETAMEWLLERMEDPDNDTALQSSGNECIPPRGSDETAVVTQFRDMGVSTPIADEDLGECRDDSAKYPDEIPEKREDDGSLDIRMTTGCAKLDVLAQTEKTSKQSNEEQGTTGEPTDTNEHLTIFLNDEEHSVTMNLFEALSWYAASPQSAEYLWVDALCIDQQDLQERGAQILLMGDIFSSAESVTAWLGPQSADLDDVIWLHTEFLNGVQSYFREPWMELPQEIARAYSRVPYCADFFKEIGTEDPTPKWPAYLAFCKRRWFTRMWVVQEAVFAKKLLVQCGNVSLDWEKMWLLARFLKRSEWAQYVDALCGGPGFHITGVEVTMLLDFQIMWPEMDLDAFPEGSTAKYIQNITAPATTAEIRYAFLWHMVVSLRKSDVTDLRDKIYSAYGFISRLVPDLQNEPLRPNYSLSVEEVFRSTINDAIRHSPILSFFSHIEDRSNRRLLTLPSWVPDFSVHASAPPLDGKELCVPGGMPFDVWANSDIQKGQTTITDCTLTLEGAHIDTVIEILPLDLSHLGFFGALIDFWLKIPEKYFDGTDRVEVLWRTLCTDDLEIGNYNVRRTAEEMRHSFFHWLLESLVRTWLQAQAQNCSISSFVHRHEHLKIISTQDTPAPGLPNMEQVFDKFMSRSMSNMIGLNLRATGRFLDALPPGSSEAFSKTTNYTIRGRCLYRTSRGLVGMGPLSIDILDQIWFLKAVRTPVVLRHAQETRCHTVVGECYLHGLMYGEMQQHDFAGSFSKVNLV